MPSKYSVQQKAEAMRMLEIGDHIGYVHFTTGIPERTLRDWRKKMRDRSDCQTAEKTFPSAAEWRQDEETIVDEKSQLTDASEPDNTDIEDFTYIREQLMKYARQMASDLRPNEPDSNRRTLALARILDRIQWLDEILPDRIPERVIRHVFHYDGKDQNHPPWHGASQRHARLSPENLPPNPSDPASPPDDYAN